MAVERIERHDVLNAVGLAAVLLLMAPGLVFGARSLFSTVNGGIVSAERPPEAETDDGAGTDAGGETTVTTVAEETTTTTTVVVRAPAEVTVRVGNAAGRNGVAGAGTDILNQAGYPSLTPKNASPAAASVVYYVEGYEGDAAAVARLLNLNETAIAPMPGDPGIPIDSAHLVIILGSDTTVA